MPHVPERQQDLAHALPDALLGHHEVAAAQDRRGHQEPAHGVRAVAVEHLRDVRVVPQALGHLLPVGAQHDAVADDVAEGRAVEQRRGQDVEHVEPAARLADVLHDEVRGVVGVEPLAVLERVVDLAVGHRSGVEPDIEHVLDAAHGRPPRGIVGVRPRQFVDEGAVEVHLALLVDGKPAERLLQFGERAVHVGAGVFRVVGLPHRDGAAPEAVAADGPVAGVREPLAELSVLDVARDPVDVLVELHHAVAELRHLDVPGGHRAVDQRVAAAPAMRVAVDVAGLAEQPALGFQDTGDGFVRLEDLQSGDLRERSAGVHRQEAGPLVDGEDHLDPCRLADLLVLLAVGR